MLPIEDVDLIVTSLRLEHLARGGHEWADHSKQTTHIKIERYSHDRQEPQDLVEPAYIAMEPFLLLLCQWKEEPIKEVDGHQRDGVQD